MRWARMYKGDGDYGDYLVKIVLYGSYARCEQTPESDVDIAVILKNGNTEQMHDEMTDIVVDYELDQGVTLSVVPIEYEQYAECERRIPGAFQVKESRRFAYAGRRFYAAGGNSVGG